MQGAPFCSKKMACVSLETRKPNPRASEQLPCQQRTWLRVKELLSSKIVIICLKRDPQLPGGFSVFSVLLHMFKFINMKESQPFQCPQQAPFLKPSLHSQMWENRRKEFFEVVPPNIPLVVFYEACFFQTWHAFIKHDVLLPLYT